MSRRGQTPSRPRQQEWDKHGRAREVRAEPCLHRAPMQEVVELRVTGIQVERLVLESRVLQLERQQGLDNQDSEQNGTTDPRAAAKRAAFRPDPDRERRGAALSLGSSP